jgi:hypothetical protein
MTADARVCTQRKRYIFDPEEGLRIVLARLSTVGRWREVEQVFFRSAGACYEIVYFVVGTSLHSSLVYVIHSTIQ